MKKFLRLSILVLSLSLLVFACTSEKVETEQAKEETTIENSEVKKEEKVEEVNVENNNETIKEEKVEAESDNN